MTDAEFLRSYSETMLRFHDAMTLSMGGGLRGVCREYFEGRLDTEQFIAKVDRLAEVCPDQFALGPPL